MTQEYDVFVSFKNLDSDGEPTRDSQLAKEVHRHLTSRGMTVFFSNVSLETLGIAQYKKAIDDALDAAHTLVAVGTSGENLDSQWVRYEWDSFFNDILSGFKPKARVFAYIEGAEPKDLPRALRQTQTFVHGPDSLDHLHSFIANALDKDQDQTDATSQKQQCSERIVYLLDFSNEVMYGAGDEPIARKRLIFSDGYIFFVDPTQPMEPQREDFAQLIAELRGRSRSHPELNSSPPVAICVPKLDLILGEGENPMSSAIKQLSERVTKIDSMLFSAEHIDSQSNATLEALKRIWPDWRIEKQIGATLGSDCRFFPMVHPLRSKGVADSEQPSSPALEPLIWLLQQLGCNSTKLN